MTDRPHEQLAADCWHQILVLLMRDDTVTAWDTAITTAAERLIEQACDRALELERLRQLHACVKNPDVR